MFFTIKQYLHLNCVFMQNWIVCNRIDYLHKMYLALDNLQRLICHKIQPTNLISSVDQKFHIEKYKVPRENIKIELKLNEKK